MPDSLNQQIADALTEHHIQDARVETDVRRQAWAQLAILEADLLAALKVADPTEPSLLARRKRRVQALLDEEIMPLVTSRYATIAEILSAAMRRLVRSEAIAMARIVNEIAGDEVLSEIISADTLRQMVDDTLLPTVASPTDLSMTAADWWERLGQGLVALLSGQLLVSVSLGESLTETIARVRGTSDKGFTDGVMAKARDDAAKIVRLEATNAVSEARVAVSAANAERLVAIEHSSTIDTKTSLICLGRNGLRYTADTHEPIHHTTPYLSGVPYHVG